MTDPIIQNGWHLSKTTEGQEATHIELTSGDSTIKKISCRILSSPSEKRTWGETFGLRSRITITDPETNEQKVVKVWNKDFGKPIGFGGMRTHISQVIKAHNNFTRSHSKFLETVHTLLENQNVPEEKSNEILYKISSEIEDMFSKLKTKKKPPYAETLQTKNFFISIESRTSTNQTLYILKIATKDKNDNHVLIEKSLDTKYNVTNSPVEAFKEKHSSFLTDLKGKLLAQNIPQKEATDLIDLFARAFDNIVPSSGSKQNNYINGPVIGASKNYSGTCDCFFTPKGKDKIAFKRDKDGNLSFTS